MEQRLISRLKTFSLQDVVEVENFVEFLAAKTKRRVALDRLPAMASALEAANVVPVSERRLRPK